MNLMFDIEKLVFDNIVIPGLQVIKFTKDLLCPDEVQDIKGFDIMEAELITQDGSRHELDEKYYKDIQHGVKVTDLIQNIKHQPITKDTIIGLYLGYFIDGSYENKTFLIDQTIDA